MLHWKGLAFGLAMAILDVIGLGIVKKVSMNYSKLWMIIPTIIYMFQPWIFLSALNVSSLTIMNLSWDLISDILVTLLGIFYFKEKIAGTHMIGLLLGGLSLILLSQKDQSVKD